MSSDFQSKFGRASRPGSISESSAITTTTSARRSKRTERAEAKRISHVDVPNSSSTSNNNGDEVARPGAIAESSSAISTNTRTSARRSKRTERTQTKRSHVDVSTTSNTGDEAGFVTSQDHNRDSAEHQHQNQHQQQQRENNDHSIIVTEQDDTLIHREEGLSLTGTEFLPIASEVVVVDKDATQTPTITTTTATSDLESRLSRIEALLVGEAPQSDTFDLKAQIARLEAEKQELQRRLRESERQARQGEENQFTVDNNNQAEEQGGCNISINNEHNTIVKAEIISNPRCKCNPYKNCYLQLAMVLSIFATVVSIVAWPICICSFVTMVTLQIIWCFEMRRRGLLICFSLSLLNGFGNFIAATIILSTWTHDGICSPFTLQYQDYDPSMDNSTQYNDDTVLECNQQAWAIVGYVACFFWLLVSCGLGKFIYSYPFSSSN